MLVVLDLGNSSLKMGVFEDSRLLATERFEGGCAIADGVILSPHVAQAAEVVVGCSAPAQLAALLRSLGRPARVLGLDVVAAVPTTYEHPGDLGIDRVAAAWGARELVGGGPAVVADIGTAVTVDALDRDGRFVAVAIAPGPQAAVDGLARAAPHLPRAAFGDPPGAPARGTRDSLVNGLAFGVAGLVDRLAREARRVLRDDDAPLVLTGGSAAVVARLLPRTTRIGADCVLHGLRALHAAVPAGASAATGGVRGRETAR